MEPCLSVLMPNYFGLSLFSPLLTVRGSTGVYVHIQFAMKRRLPEPPRRQDFHITQRAPKKNNIQHLNVCVLFFGSGES